MHGRSPAPRAASHDGKNRTFSRLGLRALQDEAALGALLDCVFAARGDKGPPVFLKLAPDLEPADIDAICRIALDRRLDALIVSNTTVSRPALRSRHRDEAGGLSGAPLRDLALQRLREIARCAFRAGLKGWPAAPGSVQ